MPGAWAWLGQEENIGTDYPVAPCSTRFQRLKPWRMTDIERGGKPPCPLCPVCPEPPTCPECPNRRRLEPLSGLASVHGLCCNCVFHMGGGGVPLF